MTCDSNGACAPTSYDAWRSMGGACYAWEVCDTDGCATNTTTGEDTCIEPVNQTSVAREPEVLLASSELDGWALVAVRVVTPRVAVQVATAR